MVRKIVPLLVGLVGKVIKFAARFSGESFFFWVEKVVFFLEYGNAFASSLQCKQLAKCGRLIVRTIAWCRPFCTAAVREARYLFDARVQGQDVTKWVQNKEGGGSGESQGGKRGKGEKEEEEEEEG